MKSPRHLLVLVGLLCQGLTWTDYSVPGIYALAWLAAIMVGQNRWRIPMGVEAAALLGGVTGGYMGASALGYSTHFAFGHGLALLQLVRLLRPLSYREKFVSILIAVFHLAMACTFLFDYRFLAIALAAFLLVPRALAQITSEWFATEDAGGTGAAAPRLSLGRWTYASIALLMLGMFLVFPRGFFTGGLRLPVTRPGEQNTLLDTVLDPARSGGANSRRILFQVQGERLGYLRCYVLPDFDGRLWTMDPGRERRTVEYVDTNQVAHCLHRRVRVKNPSFLGRTLPVDGRVAAVTGTFLRRPYVTTHGLIAAETMWTGPNNVYEYWVRTQDYPGRWDPELLWRFLKLPPQSDRLRAWLDQVLAGTTNAYQQAKLLEGHLCTRFTYQLGAPELNRLNPTDDFVFNQRAGHCERFASTLAVLLRMKGIPSRVVIGYLPARPNRISGWYDIRLRDAHAWVEAWFPDRGWQTLDGTPAASLPPPSAWSDWLEELDFAWYAHVVNYDAPAQLAVWQTLVEHGGNLWDWVRDHRVGLATTAGAVAVILAGVYWWRVRRRAPKKETPQRASQILAHHYYGQMLQALARRGLHREPAQTPLEFLSAWPAGAGDPAPVELITRHFCATQYGERILTDDDKTAIEHALSELKQ